MKKFLLIKNTLAIVFLLLIIVSGKSQSNAPIGCSGQFFVTHGSGGTATSTTSVKKLSFSGLTITPNVFNIDPSSVGFNAIGINPVDGYMYGLRYPTSGNRVRLVRIGNGTPNNIVDLGEVTNAGGNLADEDFVYAGCFDINGVFYFISDNNELFRISGNNYPTSSLTTTFIGNTPGGGTGTNFFVDIAIDPVTSTMYGVTFNQRLLTINTTTGATTFIGTHTGTNFIAGLFFDEVGNLFGYRADGNFFLINKTNAALTPAGTGTSYNYADGCSCVFGRVFHDLDFTANPGNQVCPTNENKNPTFPLVVSVTNQTGSQKTGLTYTLNISDPAKRFRFTENTTTIKNNLVAAGLATASSTVTLSTEAPATGTNYNKLVVTGFQTGNSLQTLSFTLQVQFYTLGNPYNDVPLQSVISGLPVAIGSTDLSNDPTSAAPDDPTLISFCPNITLPVELSSFTARRINTNVDLKWTTSNEQNNAGFYIERQVGTNTWENIGFVASQAVGGNSSERLDYSFADPNNTKSISQYRLRQVDLDSRAKYSEIRSVKGLDQKTGIIVYPNPTNDGRINVVFDDASATRNISVLDMSGRTVKQINNITSNNITIDNLVPGMYSLRIVVPQTGEQIVQKVVVNKR